MGLPIDDNDCIFIFILGFVELIDKILNGFGQNAIIPYVKCMIHVSINLFRWENIDKNPFEYGLSLIFQQILLQQIFLSTQRFSIHNNSISDLKQVIQVG